MSNIKFNFLIVSAMLIVMSSSILVTWLTVKDPTVETVGIILFTFLVTFIIDMVLRPKYVTHNIKLKAIKHLEEKYITE